MPKAKRGISEPTLAGFRALSIGQPWAELILLGRKPYELRTWRTNYRGPLLIHASQKFVADAAQELGIDRNPVVRGAFVGTAMLTDVRPFTKADARLLKEKRGGNGWWEPDQYAWVLTNVRRIAPIPFAGQLRLFSPPASVLRRVGALSSASCSSRAAKRQ